MLASILLAVTATAPWGHIAFLRAGDDGSAQVCIYGVVSEEITPIGPGRNDGPPVWSPDGNHLAFETDTVDGGRGIMIATLNGEATLIEHYFRRNIDPAWAPDGRRIAYSAGDDPASTSIIVYDTATSREVVWGGDTRGLMQPEWFGGRALDTFIGAATDYGWREGIAGTLLQEAARQGALMASGFVPAPGGIGTDIFVVSQNAAIAVPSIVLASPDPYDEWLPATHPREERIAFESNDGGDREIFVLSFRTGTFDLSNHRAADWNPLWTPDLGWVAFESFRSGRRGLYRGNVESVRVEPIAESSEHDNWGISYGPEGGRFVFVSNRDGTPALYIQDGYGATPRRIDTGGPAGEPAWRPGP
jgi:Tol biopolymer transport system component